MGKGRRIEGGETKTEKNEKKKKKKKKGEAGVGKKNTPLPQTLREHPALVYPCTNL